MLIELVVNASVFMNAFTSFHIAKSQTLNNPLIMLSRYMTKVLVFINVLYTSQLTAQHCPYVAQIHY